ncbi:hypothetical protein MNBD_GAMMA16-2007 [hydrothermal vent metagenome]|uniref:TraB/GumN family protein n=1 Tax=hydrothermal vent metagenome TaxID=652676 RepID=A0A3B0ZEP1_9ZZZZ
MKTILAKTFFWGTMLWLILLSAVAFASNENETLLYNKGLLWSVSKGEAKNFVFGTIHSDDPRVLAVLDHVYPTFDAAKNFTLEMDLNPISGLMVAQAMLIDDGQTLSDLIGEDLYQKVLKIAVQHGLPKQAVNLLKPWAVMTVISVPKQQSDTFMDLILYEKAHQQNKKVVGLETPAEQIAVFDALELADQITLLQNAVTEYNNLADMFDRLIELYQARDLQAMLKMSDELAADSGERLADTLTQRLVISRNKIMVKRMLPLLTAGETFVAVGALHLPGKHGILQTLARKGYSIKRVF